MVYRKVYRCWQQQILHTNAIAGLAITIVQNRQWRQPNSWIGAFPRPQAINMYDVRIRSTFGTFQVTKFCANLRDVERVRHRLPSFKLRSQRTLNMPNLASSKNCYNDGFAPKRLGRCNQKQLQRIRRTVFEQWNNKINFEISNLLFQNKLRAFDFSIQLKSDTQLVTFLKRAESLEILKMGYGIITHEILVSLSQLTNLRELRLYSCSFNSTKLKILRQLTKLELHM